MWVKLTLAPVVRASWLLRMSRLTSSRRAGTERTLVAVGTPRLASMLATMRDAAPRSDGGLLASRSAHRQGPERAAASRPCGGCGGAAGGQILGTAAPPPSAVVTWLWGREPARAGNRRKLAPALADRVRIGQEAVVHVVDQPPLGPNAPPAPPNWVMSHPTGGGRGWWAVRVVSALPMPYPAALQISARPAPAPGAATVVFVHGSLDRGESFRRVMRRLPELTTVTYDRRGYQGSRAAASPI